MKNIVISSVLLAMLGLGATTVMAEGANATQTKANEQTMLQASNFVDENEDGVCDLAAQEAQGDCTQEQTQAQERNQVQAQKQNRNQYQNQVQNQEQTQTQTQSQTRERIQAQENDGECQNECDNENAFANQAQEEHNYSKQ